ncbi:MAG: universal stress protein, partial [Geminicoccaceae bacterium]
AEQQQMAAKKTFEQACKTASISLANLPKIAAGQPSLARTAGQPSAAWTDVTGRRDDVVARQALLSDLVVFGTNGVDDSPAFRPTLEAVLLKSRRPILLAPKKVSEHIGHNVAIAWNGTAEAASAFAGAMPFLESAVAVHLITAVTSRTEVDSVDDVANYLAWHGIGSERRVIDVDGEPVGAALMREAVNIGADLLVMGGYGHHRLRERILGGATHHVLDHAGLPILVAH